MTLQQVAAELLSLVESDGPEVLGGLLELVAPQVPVQAIVDLSVRVVKLVDELKNGTEKSQVQAAVSAADAAADTAEAAALQVVK